MAIRSLLQVQNLMQNQLLNKFPPLVNLGLIRCASKKAGTSSRNKSAKRQPKHRGWKFQDGNFVQAGTILVTQLNLRFLPGLNVGFGINGNLFAIEAGRVVVTCERTDLNKEHTWIKRIYEGREHLPIYKKYFNVLPEPQHNRFKLVDRI